MSRSCFASFPVCLYKFSSHYLNNLIIYRQLFGASSERLTLYNLIVIIASCLDVCCVLTVRNMLYKFDNTQQDGLPQRNGDVSFN